MHPSLEISSWKLLTFNNSTTLSYNQRVLFQGLKIDARKFFFFLQEKYGLPIIDFNTVKQFFQERDIRTEKVWCYGFTSDTNYVFVTGDEYISIAVLSMLSPPEKLDFDLFCSSINDILKRKSLKLYEKDSYDIYINYSVFLESLIKNYKQQLNEELPKAPEVLELSMDELNTNEKYVKYKEFEYSKDYNLWLSKLRERASIQLQIQILLPIYFESLVDLSFRINLKKSLYHDKKIYSVGNQMKDVFSYFEQLPLYKKFEEIRKKCFGVDDVMAVKFIEYFNDNNSRKKRNKLLHGNSLFFQNTNLKYYVSKGYVIGFPDRHNAIRMIADSLSHSMINDSVIEEIEQHEILCNKFIDIFYGQGAFRSIVKNVAFGHNTIYGGDISIGINNFEDLYIPVEK
jgi:hypothetical protein